MMPTFFSDVSSHRATLNNVPYNAPEQSSNKRKRKASHEHPPGFPSLQFRNGTRVSVTTKIRKEGNVYFATIQDGSEVKVFNRHQFANNRLKYLDGRLVEIDADVREEPNPRGAGSCYFVQVEGAPDIQVFTAANFSHRQLKVAKELNKSRFKYANGSFVPVYANTRVEITGQRQGRGYVRYYFARIGNEPEQQVWTPTIWSHNKLKYDDGTLVPLDAKRRIEIVGKNKRRYWIQLENGSEVQAFTSNAMTFKSQKARKANNHVMNHDTSAPRASIIHSSPCLSTVAQRINFNLSPTSVADERVFLLDNHQESTGTDLLLQNVMQYIPSSMFFNGPLLSESLDPDVPIEQSSRKRKASDAHPPEFPPLQFRNGAQVPATAEIRQEGDLYFITIQDGSEVQVLNKQQFTDGRLKYTDGRLVEVDTVIREEPHSRNSGKCYFVQVEGAPEIQVYTAASIYGRLFRYVDGSFVPEYANTREERIGQGRGYGSYYFARIGSEPEQQVWTSTAWNHNKKRHLTQLGNESEVQVFASNAMVLKSRRARKANKHSTNHDTNQLGASIILNSPNLSSTDVADEHGLILDNHQENTGADLLFQNVMQYIPSLTFFNDPFLSESLDANEDFVFEYNNEALEWTSSAQDSHPLPLIDDEYLGEEYWNYARPK